MQGAIFDMDGTLLDSMPAWSDSADRFLMKRGVCPPPGLYEALKDLSMVQTADYLRERFGIPGTAQDVMDGINEVMEESYFHRIPPKADILSFVERLSRAGVRMCVATATDRPLVEGALERLGVLDQNLLAVHTVWLTNEEVELFRKRDVKVSHNPASAMRVLGFAKIPRMLREGICVSIGTDGASSSNRMDMVDEMWLTSLIHKGWRLDPTVVPSQTILQMATINGAKALLDGHLYGSLEPGKKADLIVIDPYGPSMMPVHDMCGIEEG